MRELCIVWLLGIVIFMCSNGNMGAIYAGRFIAGIGMSLATTWRNHLGLIPVSRHRAISCCGSCVRGRDSTGTYPRPLHMFLRRLCLFGSGYCLLCKLRGGLAPVWITISVGKQKVPKSLVLDL